MPLSRAFLKKTNIHLLLFFLIVGIDQFTKWGARETGIVQLNTGVSLGLFNDFSVLLHIFIFLLTIIVLLFTFKNSWQKHAYYYVAILAAGFSNVIDRVIWGGVQDFLPVPFFQVQNNIADWVIFIAFLGIFVSNMQPEVKKESSES